MWKQRICLQDISFEFLQINKQRQTIQEKNRKVI